jgi:hypothetical protein
LGCNENAIPMPLAPLRRLGTGLLRTLFALK